MSLRIALDAIIEPVYDIAKKAGEAIIQTLDNRSHNALQVDYKADQSVVTNVDILAHELITHALSALSDYPIVSEEQPLLSHKERAQWSTYWCVDPLDGTRDLIEGTQHYTVNIALIHEHKPVLGVVYVPAQKIGFIATQSQGAYEIDAQYNRRRIHTRDLNPKQWLIALSRYHHQNRSFINKIAHLPGVSITLMGSSLKICKIATGEIDCYPRLGPMHDWDLAAAQIILEEAGGAILDLNLQPLTYNKHPDLLQSSFIAIGDLKADWQGILENIRKLSLVS